MRSARLAVAAGCLLLLAACSGLPPRGSAVVTVADMDTDATRLGRAVVPLTAANAGKSGIHPLPVPADAFAARALLAGAADRALDVQYYIWHGDQTGYLLFEALWKAAERGVRVRLLLDDNNTAGLDSTIAALDAHPNIEVRLYNPFAHRSLRAIDYVTDFTRVNRRMHNKSFTADNQATIVGGRNVGNEYAGAGQGVVFEDLDVIAVGPAVREVSKAFDLYWNSPSAYPAAGLVAPAGPDAAAGLEARFAAVNADPESVDYVEALRETPLVRDMLAGKLQFEWATTRLLFDDPAKTLDAAARKDLLLLDDLLQTGVPPRQSFDLVSPYFVPGEAGAAALGRLARRGVTVRVLTNSLAATDVSAVHAGYAKRRRDLLEAGVRLYELKSTLLDDGRAGKRNSGGSSSASLHAKTFAADRERIFVGSFNFDPRSALLNTEMGFLIDSPALARRLSGAFDADISREAYEVRVSERGGLEWVERTPTGEVLHETEPQTGFFQRLWIRFLSVFPIDWLL